MRSFHAIEPDHQFIFHTRNDIPPRKGEIGNDVELKGSRAATIAVLVKGTTVKYGVARCQWAYQFCRKLARDVAIGRAKQAFVYADPMKWDKHGTIEGVSLADPKEIYKAVRTSAVELIRAMSMRAEQNGYVGGDIISLDNKRSRQ